MKRCSTSVSRTSERISVIELETDRLTLSRFTLDDAPFIFALLNEPSFTQFIGDKGIDTLEDAAGYLRDVPIAHYARHEYGLYRVGLKPDGTAVGMCGLVNREEFPAPDLGFAFLKAYWALGYAYESSVAVLHAARERHGLPRVLAMADEGNVASTRLLEKLGFNCEGTVTMPGETTPVLQYAVNC